jgi:uncharacterized protein YkwD
MASSNTPQGEAWRSALRVTLLALAAAGTLAACGGGGGGGSGPAAPAPAPAPPPPPPAPPPSGSTDPQATLCTQFSKDLARSEAGVNYLNTVRSAANAPLLTHNAAITDVIHRHVTYLIVNNEFTHYQTQGKPCFLGAAPADRFVAGSVGNYGFASESLAGVSGGTQASDRDAIDLKLDSIYHRFVLLAAEAREAGVSGANTVYGLNVGARTVDTAPSNRVVLWPFAGQGNVPTTFFSDLEQPDPVPERGEVGYPITVNVAPNMTLNVVNARLVDGAGNVVETRLLAPGRELARNQAALVPLNPLAEQANYTVSMRIQINGMTQDIAYSFRTSSEKFRLEPRG